MPAAICKTCGDIWYWRNRRGARIADYKCHKCGGAYGAATVEDGKYVLRKSEKGEGNKGRKKAPCAICGANCIAPAGKEPITVTLYGRWFCYEMPVVIEPDDVICRRHCLRESWSSHRLYMSDFDRETQDWLTQQVNGVGVNYYFPTERGDDNGRA